VRTQEEILQRIKDRKKLDFFGFETGVYIEALTYANAKEYLQDDVTEKDWNEDRAGTDDKVRASAIGYMPFAWEKANDARSMSAMRSIQKYIA
jgi:hypothetical protein